MSVVFSTPPPAHAYIVCFCLLINLTAYIHTHTHTHPTHTHPTQQLGVILQKLSHMDLNKCRVILHQLRSYGSNDKWLYRLM